MLIVVLPLLVCLVGLVVYALASNPKAAELGRLMFFAGLLFTLAVAGSPAVRLLR